MFRRTKFWLFTFVDVGVPCRVIFETKEEVSLAMIEAIEKSLKSSTGKPFVCTGYFRVGKCKGSDLIYKDGKLEFKK